MATRRRKSRKKRGTRTVGYGRVGQHRKHGDQGGHGKAGLHKHKWSWAVKYAKEHFGRHGFRPPTPSSKAERWVNISDLDAIYDKIKKGVKEKEGLKVIDLTSMGIDKLLGSGSVKGSYYVMVRGVSKRAKEKVEKAGGKVEVTLVK